MLIQVCSPYISVENNYNLYGLYPPLQALHLYTYLLNLSGVDNSDTLKVSRSGGADPDGDQPGDLYVIFKVSVLSYNFPIDKS